MKHIRSTDPKSEALRDEGGLNPRPERVTDELFRKSEFFDPKDLPQVKYEMLRRVQHDRVPIAKAAKDFGFSRPSFYAAQEAFTSGGLPGLLPKKRGPRGPHKLDAEVMRFVDEVRTNDPTISAAALVSLLKERIGLEVHTRSVERAIARQEKKRP